jgi:hypothetical protein
MFYMEALYAMCRIVNNVFPHNRFNGPIRKFSSRLETKKYKMIYKHKPIFFTEQGRNNVGSATRECQAM